jgi:uncharacterized protein (DUF302 family)
MFVLAAICVGSSFADEGQRHHQHAHAHEVGFLTPFVGVASVPVTADAGENEFLEAENQAEQVAITIATYVALVDEKDQLGFIDNWLLAGYEGEVTIEQAILHVPTNYLIDENNPDLGTKTVYIVEMCNPTFAKKALGVTPIVEDDPDSVITNGHIHAPALPCEVAVYVEDTDIRIDMLDPEAIFTLFFTDVLFGDQMEDEEFAAAVQELPATVKAEIRTIIYTALEEGDFVVAETDEQLGPKYCSLEEVAKVVEETEYESPYVHFKYDKTDGTDFTQDEAGEVAAAIIAVLAMEDKSELDLNYTWKSPRPAPLPVPGNFLVEACSPENAKAAMDMGMYHATALPCAITTKAVDDDGDGTVELFLTYLSPHFMFNAMFSDVFPGMTEDELEEIEQQAADVLEDLQDMVAAALEEFDVSEPDRVDYDMLPDEPPTYHSTHRHRHTHKLFTGQDD